MTFKVTTTKLNFGDAYRYLFSGWISWENSTGANACLFWLISHSLALILDERLATFFLRWSNIVFITTRIKEGFGVLDEQNAIMQSLLSRWCGCEVPNEVAESRILPFMSCREQTAIMHFCEHDIIWGGAAGERCCRLRTGTMATRPFTSNYIR